MAILIVFVDALHVGKAGHLVSVNLCLLSFSSFRLLVGWGLFYLGGWFFGRGLFFCGLHFDLFLSRCLPICRRLARIRCRLFALRGLISPCWLLALCRLISCWLLCLCWLFSWLLHWLLSFGSRLLSRSLFGWILFVYLFTHFHKLLVGVSNFD